MIVRLTDAALAGLLIGLLGFAGGYWLGLHEGASDVQASHDNEQVRSLTRLLAATDALIDEANTAGADLRTQTAARAQLDNDTTRKLKDALKKSEGSRTDCRFDVVSLRLLEDARERANQAAATGVLNALPSAARAKK